MPADRITTTTSIEEPALVRCEARVRVKVDGEWRSIVCNRLARGGQTISQGGVPVGICCAIGVERELLLGLVGDAPEPVESVSTRRPQTL
jgi:hypothetical protein